MPQSTFTAPDVTTFCGLDDLGLIVVGQDLRPGRAVLDCRMIPSLGDAFCKQCGLEGSPRDNVTRRLSHLPVGWRPTILEVRVARYRCESCLRVWRADMTRAAQSRSKLSRGALTWALRALVVNHMSVSRVAASLAVSWNTANTAVLAEGKRTLIDDPHRFDGVRVIGVDEHVWRHTRKGDKYVTVIIDLTPVRDQSGPSRLLDMVEGRSKEVFKNWLAGRPPEWKDQVEVVAMDGFSGFKTAAGEELPGATTVMDPFHVVRLGGDALDDCRRRVQQQTLGRRGRKGDPLYSARRTLLTGANLLNEKQDQRINLLFADEKHTGVEVTWVIYQRMIAAYRDDDRARGKTAFESIIADIGTGACRALPELAKLGGTLKKRAADILAYFDRPGTSNGPTEATNGRLIRLRGIALGFRNLTHYIARSLLETGGFRPQLHSQL